MLLIGQENINKLRDRRVAVFGIGGVGGHCVEAICRCGIGMIDIFDGDVVEVTNINRQIIATNSTVSRDKVGVMRERLLDINPDAVINARKLFYLPETADDIDLAAYDYVIDAVDTITAKIELVCRTTALNVPIISSMGTANKLDPTAFKVDDIFNTSVCPIARIMRSELRKRGIGSLKVVYSTETPKTVDRPQTNYPAESGCSSPSHRPLPASISFVPPVAGLILASEVIRALLYTPDLQRDSE